MVAPQVSCPPVVSLRYIMYQPPASVRRRRQGEVWGGRVGAIPTSPWVAGAVCKVPHVLGTFTKGARMLGAVRRHPRVAGARGQTGPCEAPMVCDCASRHQWAPSNYTHGHV